MLQSGVEGPRLFKTPDCIVVVVEWLYFFERIIIDKKADLTDFVSLIFFGKMCDCVSRPMKIVTFLRKNGDHPKTGC